MCLEYQRFLLHACCQAATVEHGSLHTDSTLRLRVVGVYSSCTKSKSPELTSFLVILIDDLPAFHPLPALHPPPLPQGGIARGHIDTSEYVSPETIFRTNLR